MDQALQDPDQGKGFFVSSTPAGLSWGERKSPMACDDSSIGLSSMYGAGMTTTSSATEAQKKVAAVAMAFLDRMWGWDERVPDTPFSELLKVRGVDYRGE